MLINNTWLEGAYLLYTENPVKTQEYLLSAFNFCLFRFFRPSFFLNICVHKSKALKILYVRAPFSSTSD